MSERAGEEEENDVRFAEMVGEPEVARTVSGHGAEGEIRSEGADGESHIDDYG